MRRISLALCATALLVSAASAADLPPRPAYKAPAYVAPAFSWTGGYVGANLGYGWGSGSGTITVAGAGTGPVSGSASGILGGGQIGYNWQGVGNPWVLGVEADFQGSGVKGTVTATPGPTVATAETPWFGTIRGRVGYAFDRTLVYATGGGVYGHSTLNGTIATTGPFSSSADYWTWTVGGGVERMFIPNWSAKLEYLYTDTPDKAPTPPNTTALTGTTHGHIVRAGVNYHF